MSRCANASENHYLEKTIVAEWHACFAGSRPTSNPHLPHTINVPLLELPDEMGGVSNPLYGTGKTIPIDVKPGLS